jgi:hypothetical protein
VRGQFDPRRNAHRVEGTRPQARQHVLQRAQQPEYQDAHSPNDRLRHALSKKVENHAHAMALHFMYYSFMRILKTLRMTPAMAAGVSKRLWENERCRRHAGDLGTVTASMAMV